MGIELYETSAKENLNVDEVCGQGVVLVVMYIYHVLCVSRDNHMTIMIAV